ncbi:hypothetical protein MTQ16_10605 [Corynebacterium bovis]|uniref:hypothetical protein n=1 Tax=Corynebacterium bovis TaxID=36808 RepID=UPI003139139B
MPAALAASVVLWGVQLTVLTVWGGRHGQSLGDVLSQWDTQWMSRIALHGYAGWTEGGNPSQWQSIAFFPGYPVLLRIVSAPLVVFGVESATLLAGCLLSAVLAAAMVVGLVRLVGDGLDAVPPQTLIGRIIAVLFDGRDGDRDGDRDADRDGDRGAAPHAGGRGGVAARVTAGAGDDEGPSPATATAVAALALGAPMSAVYWMPYSESLFGVCAVWCLVMLRRHRFLAAGVLAGVAGLTRLTAVALVVTLGLAALVETVRVILDRRAGAGSGPAGDGSGSSVTTPLTAWVATVVSAVPLALYIAWADGQAAPVGGYFGAQDSGWHSGFDGGRATMRWLRERTFVGPGDGGDVGYIIAGLSVIAVVLIGVVSLWPLLRGALDWRLWLPAAMIAGIVVFSDGIMHSRPRLLIFPVLVLLLPWVAAGARRWRWAFTVPFVVAWCVLGFFVSGWLLVPFRWAI